MFGGVLNRRPLVSSSLPSNRSPALKEYPQENGKAEAPSAAGEAQKEDVELSQPCAECMRGAFCLLDPPQMGGFELGVCLQVFVARRPRANGTCKKVIGSDATLARVSAFLPALGRQLQGLWSWLASSSSSAASWSLCGP